MTSNTPLNDEQHTETIPLSRRKALKVGGLLAAGSALGTQGGTDVVSAASTSDHQRARQQIRDAIIGANLNTSNSRITNRIRDINSTAQDHWNHFKRNCSDCILFTNISGDNKFREVGTSYDRLLTMTKAYLLPDGSLEGNADLLADVKYGLDLLYENYYNRNSSAPPNSPYLYKVAAPDTLVRITTLLYTKLSSTQRSDYMSAVGYWKSGFGGPQDGDRGILGFVTAARGAIIEDGSEIQAGVAELKPLFTYVSDPPGDGFYRDGSFINHGDHPSNGAYGHTAFKGSSLLLTSVRDTPWDPTQTDWFQNYLEILQKGYIRLINNSLLMTRPFGRSRSRGAPRITPSEGYLYYRSVDFLGYILRSAQFAPDELATTIKKFVKHQLQSVEFFDPLQYLPTIAVVGLADELLRNDLEASDAGFGNHVFHNTDMSMMKTSDFGVEIAQYSTRIANYAARRNENLHGWHQGRGMTLLHTDDQTQFTDAYWPTVDPYRMPGTTVVSKMLPDLADRGRSNAAWVGGSSLGDVAASGMQMDPDYAPITGKKSWLMFDDEVVCLGADITTNQNDPRSRCKFSNFTVGGNEPPSLITYDSTPAQNAEFDVEDLIINAGGGKFWKNNDEYGALIEKDLTGGVVAQVTVDSQEPTGNEANAGIYIANDATAAGSSAGDVAVAVRPPGDKFALYFDSDGDGYVDTGTVAGSTSYPCELRVTKEGTTFTGEYSTDGGSTWNTIDSVESSYAKPTQDIGLWVCAKQSAEGADAINNTETTILNRKLNSSGDNRFVVDGTQTATDLGWNDSVANPSWAWLEDTGGYYFPTEQTFQAKREERSGGGDDINTQPWAWTYDEVYHRNYLTLWKDHGTNPSGATYEYVLLPDKTESETADYASSPDVTVLANDPTKQAVKTPTYLAANFWSSGTVTESSPERQLTANSPASVVLERQGDELSIGVADPIQTQDTVTIEFDHHMNALQTEDSTITVKQLYPTAIIKVDVANSSGDTHTATFTTSPSETATEFNATVLDSAIMPGKDGSKSEARIEASISWFSQQPIHNLEITPELSDAWTVTPQETPPKMLKSGETATASWIVKPSGSVGLGAQEVPVTATYRTQGSQYTIEEAVTVEIVPPNTFIDPLENLNLLADSSDTNDLSITSSNPQYFPHPDGSEDANRAYRETDPDTALIYAPGGEIGGLYVEYHYQNSNSDGDLKIYESTDAGENWTQITPNVTEYDQLSDGSWQNTKWTYSSFSNSVDRVKLVLTSPTFWADQLGHVEIGYL